MIESEVFTHNVKSTDKIIREHLKRIQKSEKKESLDDYIKRVDKRHRNPEGKFFWIYSKTEL